VGRRLVAKDGLPITLAQERRSHCEGVAFQVGTFVEHLIKQA
jgi:hypothetical protein